MHLKSLRIKNYRSLKAFEVSKLGRVNLVVGKNNSGKSTVLEALRVYANASAADPYLLNELAAEHDEIFWLTEAERLSDPVDLPYENFFIGREFPVNDFCKIEIEDYLSENDSHKFTMDHVFIKIEETVSNEADENFSKKSINIVSKNAINNQNADYDDQAIRIIRGQRPSNLIPFGSRPAMPRRHQMGNNDVYSCSFIPTQFSDIDELADIWDKVQFTEHGEFVKEGLKIVAEDFENLAFVNNETDRHRLGSGRKQVTFRRTAKIKLKNAQKAIPLNSMGDGMSRVLQLLLKIYPARNGFLLIDEFENGLHFSVQEKIWAYLFDFAERLNIQVFATTHSWDCIESFAKVACEKREIDGVLFRVGKSIRTSNKGDVIATVFDEEELFNITQSDVEVR